MSEQPFRPEELRDYIATLDVPHKAYARGYADQLAYGDAAPSSAGLEPSTVIEIRKRIWAEWQRRIQGMAGSQRRR